jgi:ABC-type multidrug transport system fused ATPase/permease subunit
VSTFVVPIAVLSMLAFLPGLNIGTSFSRQGTVALDIEDPVLMPEIVAKMENYTTTRFCDPDAMRAADTPIQTRRCCEEFRWCQVTKTCSASACCNPANEKGAAYGCDPATGKCMMSCKVPPCFTAECPKPEQEKIGGAIELMIAIIIIQTAFSFQVASCAASVVREREAHQNAKHQQLVCGTSLLAYWLSFLIWDLVWALVPVGVCTGLLSNFLVFNTSTHAALPLAFVVVFVFQMAAIPCAYLQASFYTNAPAAQNGVFILNIITGVVFTIFAYIFTNVPIQVADDVGLIDLYEDYFKFVLILFPQFGLYRGIFGIGTVGYVTWGVAGSGGKWTAGQLQAISQFTSAAGVARAPEAFVALAAGAALLMPLHVLIDWLRVSSVSVSLTALPLSPCALAMSRCCKLWRAVAATFATAATRHGSNAKSTAHLNALEEGPPGDASHSDIVDTMGDDGIATSTSKVGTDGGANEADEDLDVTAERVRVTSGQSERADDVLIMNQIRKVYGNGKVAVQSTSLGIARGECFGLLGINGAGKTTTMKMMTGDITVTQGCAKLNGYNVSSQQQQARVHMGYCPQVTVQIGRGRVWMVKLLQAT